ncbi:coiled-coil domain-containing protein 157-like isoform X1 [Athene cunicularia]|uniref:coiled-coil domain-containing protein 157-like isoform X1 n=1 Tax=Athene cunicularia TaxID=194338 RepID=UPI000EF73E76|nr:coiled-coil domain-containing protein 157-like isoform X1 [Athene cunicularia]
MAACSRDESSCCVPTQTTGSPQGPCDTCDSAQASLREVGKAITSICQSQNIPSALSRFQEMVEETTEKRTLSAIDMSYWASEQSKDLSRIGKHLQMLLQQVKPLKSELEESEKQKDKLQKQVEDFTRLLQAEKETQAQQRREAEQNLEVKNREYLEAVARLERDKDDLRKGAALLEEQFSALKEELAGKQAAVQELEVTRTTLLEEMRTTMVSRNQVLELEEKVQLLTGQQESLGQELSATTTQLEKEKAKVESMLRHQESLQAKQRVLLQQLDSLDQEREELQASLGEAEEDRARLAEQLEESREQSGQQLRAQQELLDTLQQEKLSLEQSVSELQANVSKLEEQLQELKERERLLVFFPELHIPAETHFESTGSLTEDMEKQLKANSLRISMLEQENMRLRSALAKVKAAAEQGVLKLVPQTQLWAQLGSHRCREAGRQSAGTQQVGAVSPCCPSLLDNAVVWGKTQGDSAEGWAGVARSLLPLKSSPGRSPTAGPRMGLADPGETLPGRAELPQRAAPQSQLSTAWDVPGCWSLVAWCKAAAGVPSPALTVPSARQGLGTACELMPKAFPGGSWDGATLLGRGRQSWR